jgi:hypothetical protein
MATTDPVANSRRSSDRRSLQDEKVDIQEYERAVNDNGVVSQQEIQGRFDLLRDLNPEQMALLNKKVLRKVDWRLMPTITVMFLMK